MFFHPLGSEIRRIKVTAQGYSFILVHNEALPQQIMAAQYLAVGEIKTKTAHQLPTSAWRPLVQAGSGSRPINAEVHCTGALEAPLCQTPHLLLSLPS